MCVCVCVCVWLGRVSARFSLSFEVEKKKVVVFRNSLEKLQPNSLGI